MMVNVGGKQYEIDGIVYGTVPAWRLIKESGKPMTREHFEALPDADKQLLAEHVQQHIRNLRGA